MCLAQLFHGHPSRRGCSVPVAVLVASCRCGYEMTVAAVMPIMWLWRGSRNGSGCGCVWHVYRVTVTVAVTVVAGAIRAVSTVAVKRTMALTASVVSTSMTQAIRVFLKKRVRILHAYAAASQTADGVSRYHCSPSSSLLIVARLRNHFPPNTGKRRCIL